MGSNIILLIVLLVAIVVVIAGIVWLTRMGNKNKSTTNRFQRRPKRLPHIEPSVSVLKDKPEFDDPDLILGLRQEDAQQWPELVTLYVAAAEGNAFSGYELLQTLLDCHLRYGQMNIFHRHEEQTGKGSQLFSVASAEQPGTFDLNQMGGFSCQGLVMFMHPNNVANPKQVYRLMLETAGELAENLGGRVLDEDRQLLTQAHAVEILEQFEVRP